MTYLIVNIVLVSTLAFRCIMGINAGYLVAQWAIANLLGLLVAVSMKWIRVEYRDEVGKARSAYFYDSSLLGWGGILGGTKRLFRAISREQVR